MKQTIRKGVFETNSSSIHSIAIPKSKKTKLNIPKTLMFRLGEFGWDCEILSDVDSKASYLWTACQYAKNPSSLRRKIRTTLSVKYGIECTFFEPKDDDDSWYIDHGYEAGNFADTVCNNKKLLANYLFSEKSFVETGNDNGGDLEIIPDRRVFEVFFKGN